MALSHLIRALAAASIAVVIPCVAQTAAIGPYYATPSWDQKLQCDTASTCPRFVVLSNWNNEAVLDRETGVVWERQPNLFPFEQNQDWTNASFGCVQKSTGGRKGWRVPTIEELQSLLDGATNRLPAGHPFIATVTRLYWSATRLPGLPAYAYTISFDGSFGALSVNDRYYYWCVRAPGGPTY